MTPRNSHEGTQEDSLSEHTNSQMAQERTKATYRIEQLSFLAEHNLRSRLTRAFIVFIPVYLTFLYGFFWGFAAVLGGMGATDPGSAPLLPPVIMFLTSGLILGSQAWYLLSKPVHLEYRDTGTPKSTFISRIGYIAPICLLLWPVIGLSSGLIQDTHMYPYPKANQNSTLI